MVFYTTSTVMSSQAGQVLKGAQLLLFGVAGARAGAWELLNIQPNLGLEFSLIHADWNLAQAPFIAISPDDTPLQKVIKEIGGMHAASPSPASLELLAPLGWSRTEAATTAQVFAILSTSPSSSLRATGMTGLITLGLPAAVSSIDGMLTDGSQNVDEQLALLERFYDSDDPEAMKIIVSWLKASQVSVRATAAGILAKYRTPEATILLGGAIQDPDFEIRWRAIGGLSAFANHVPKSGIAPSSGPWPFRSDQTILYSVFDRKLVSENEGRYLDFWRHWWVDNQARVAVLPSSVK